jgi:nicotinamide-nucleotide amidase
MKIEIIAVGSELLTPFFQDTNSLYLTERLNDLGLDVSWKTVVGDDRQDLAISLRTALSRSDLVLVMGGLGPTEDDLTREVCAEVLERKLVFDETVFRKIEERFKRRGRTMPASNKKQAFVIENADVLENQNGTAPGMWLTSGGAKVALLPGPPPEIGPMFEEAVWPRLELLHKGATVRQILKITGLTESDVESRISGLYPDQKKLRLTVLASPGQIELHLSAFSRSDSEEAERAVERLAHDLRGRLGDNVFSASGEDLETVVGRRLRIRKQTLATAESCSGGLLAERITKIPGSSEYYLEGFITYSDRAKNSRLGVSWDVLNTFGAVSSETAEAMAAGCREKTGADYALAITGIAGPSGATLEKPVGLVYTALAGEGGVEVQKNLFLGKREQVKFQSAQRGLDMLRRALLESEKAESGRNGG